MGMGRDRDRQDYQDLDGLRWTIFARMDRIVGMGMGLDGQDCLDGDRWGCTGLPGWGLATICRDADGPGWTIWARMDSIVGMGMGLD